MTLSVNKITSKPRRGRPPKILRENQDTRAELIRSGLEHLTEYGFSSSGIEPILKKIGVPKGSFYHYFENKEAFGRAVIESYAKYFITKLDACLLDESFLPLTRISNFVDSAKAGMERHQFKRGCLVGNLGQEVDLLPESFRPQLIEILLCWQHSLANCLKAAQTQGSISNTVDCELLAEYFWIGWEGAVSRAKLVQNSQPLENYLSHFMMTLPK